MLDWNKLRRKLYLLEDLATDFAGDAGDLGGEAGG
jgi:hypothetical protein